MTQEQREKLIFCTGLLSGLQWIVESNSIAEALQSVQEDIETLLKEESLLQQANLRRPTACPADQSTTTA